MRELLDVNDRYHALLDEHARQGQELERSRSECERLEVAVANAQARLTGIDTEQASMAAALKETRAALALQEDRARAAEDCNAELHRQAQDATQRVLQLQLELKGAEQRATEAERLAAVQYERGRADARAVLQKQQSSTLQKVQYDAQQATQRAFEVGRAQRAAEDAAALLREQAQRRLLLHRAEESRLQQQELQRQLERQQAISAAAEKSKDALFSRLRGVRNQKSQLADVLRATQMAHAQDLEHFQDMEAALEVACFEHAALASYNRGLLMASHQEGPDPQCTSDTYLSQQLASPPRRPSSGSALVGRESPPDAMRICAPRPASMDSRNQTNNP